jgi:uncharacterized protein (TIGR00156 family)
MKTLRRNSWFRFLVPAAALLAVCAASAFGQEVPPRGGFVEPLVSVSEAQKLGDDMPVRMRGTIVRSLGHKAYEFRDASGTITIFIDRKVWQGLSVTAQDTVEIIGEIDSDFSSHGVDVEAIQKLPTETPKAGGTGL